MDCGGTCAKCQEEKAAAKAMEPAPALAPDEKRYVHQDQLASRREQDRRAQQALRRPMMRQQPPRRPVLGARGRR